jgi:hypothetical protein
MPLSDLPNLVTLNNMIIAVFASDGCVVVLVATMRSFCDGYMTTRKEKKENGTNFVECCSRWAFFFFLARYCHLISDGQTIGDGVKNSGLF